MFKRTVCLAMALICIASLTCLFASAQSVTIGSGEAADSVELGVGDPLPVNTLIGSKYILGWSDNGTPYSGKYYEGAKLSADFVETGMLTVKYQFTADADKGSDKVDLRFVSSVDRTDRYSKVGWLFSLSDTNPTVGAANVSQRESSKVYTGTFANGVFNSAKDVYAGSKYADCANYLFVFDICDIPASQYASTIYARPYVKLNDGTVIYGKTASVTPSGVLPDAPSSSSSTGDIKIDPGKDDSHWSDWIV